MRFSLIIVFKAVAQISRISKWQSLAISYWNWYKLIRLHVPWYCRSRRWRVHSAPRHWLEDGQICTQYPGVSTCFFGTPGILPTVTTANPFRLKDYSYLLRPPLLCLWSPWFRTISRGGVLSRVVSDWLFGNYMMLCLIKQNYISICLYGL